MRSPILLATVAVLALTFSLANTAFAQESKGMHKHDASIANYSYTIPIVASDDPGNSTLKDDLDSGKAAIPAAGMASQAPAPVPAEVQPIAIGTQAPDFALPSQMGGQVSLKQLTAQGPALVLFTNGINYSGQYLQLIQRNLRQFQQLGVNVVAISPDAPQAMQAAGSYGFPILSDSSNNVARAYGVSAGYAPIPALFSVDAAGKVAAVQLQTQPNTVFDLKQATDPLRGQVQPAIASPLPVPAQLPTAPQMMAAPSAPIGQVTPDTDMMAPPSASGIPSAPPMPVMPAVPSPQSNKDIPSADVPKVSYKVPPSNPAFRSPDAVRKEAATAI
jgi:peroxiredoxin